MIVKCNANSTTIYIGHHLLGELNFVETKMKFQLFNCLKIMQLNTKLDVKNKFTGQQNSFYL